MSSKDGIINYQTLRQLVGSIYEYEEDTFAWIEKNYSIPVIDSKNGFYSKYGQKNYTLMVKQATCGKISELAVHMLLHDYKCPEPNFEINPPGVYAFDPDLKCGPFNIHVKSCESGSNFENSFTFQYENNGTIDSIFNNGDFFYDVIISCIVNRWKNMVKIYDVETWGNVKNQLEFIDGHDLPYLKGKKLFYNPCHK